MVIAISLATKDTVFQIPARVWRGTIAFERRGKDHVVRLLTDDSVHSSTKTV